MSTKSKKKTTGHPAKQDPDIDKLYRTMRDAVELVRDLKPRLSPEQHVYLRGAAAGLMFNYSALTGLPSPIEVLEGDKR